jgi:hypothetical protein
MNENTIFQDDPRLTAYALGELEGEERAHGGGGGAPRSEVAFHGRCHPGHGAVDRDGSGRGGGG